MASTNKTSQLKLNQWLGSDSPKRQDFNTDNLNIEKIIAKHLSSDLHVTSEEREQFSKANFLLGSYTGNGTATQTIDLGYKPSLLFIIASGYACAHVDKFTSQCFTFMGIGTSLGCSLGLTLTDSGFTAKEGSSTSLEDAVPMLNSANTTYITIAFK